MTVKEFIEGVSRHPALLNDQMRIVIATQQITQGEWDGAVQVSSKPVQSVTFGWQGILLYVDDSPSPVLENVAKNPAKPLAGPTPDALKSLITHKS